MVEVCWSLQEQICLLSPFYSKVAITVKEETWFGILYIPLLLNYSKKIYQKSLVYPEILLYNLSLKKCEDGHVFS